MKLYNGDCLIESDKIESGSVDLILTDLPYGNMNTDGGRKLGINGWDLAIEPKKVYDIANRILRKNGKMVLFSQEPYTTKLITEAIPNIPFNYRATWEKDNFAVALGAKVNMVSFTEDVLVFSKNNPKHDNTGNNPVREYLVSEKKKTGLTNKQLNNLFSDYTNKKGNRDRSVLEHYWGKAQFTFPTREIYENVLQPTGFFNKSYDYIEEIGKPYRLMINEKLNDLAPSTFNLWEGNKYKSNILKYKKDYTGHRPTQKPFLLLEDLIKTFSNENDLVVDLTMGSGSTGVACKNTNRDFIGIEMNEEYFKIAEQRINDTKYRLF
jgi:site-specific DNA-methyltransferase (adenine-specific)